MQKDACPRCGHSDGNQQLTLVPFSLESIASCASTMVKTVTQLAIKPVRLVVDPEVASHFSIDDIKVRNNSQFAAAGSIAATIFPATPYGHNPINNLAGIDKVQAGMEISLSITNKSNISRNFSAVIYALVDYE